MDDNGNLIYYLILGAIYLLSRFFGKKKKPPVQQNRRPSNRPDEEVEYPPIEAPTMEKEPQISFEDILRELSGVPQPKPKADPTPSPASAMEAYEAESEIEAAPLIDGHPSPAYAMDEMDEIAGELKYGKPFGSDRLAEPDLAALRRKELTFKRDDNYKLKVKNKIDYTSLLKEKDGPAKAFVLSQIFNRKY